MDIYAQLNNTLILEYFPELLKFRKTTQTLSKEKLDDLISDYNDYHKIILFQMKDKFICQKMKY